MKNKSKDKFKIIFEYSDAPDAEERIFKTLNLLVSEEDIIERHMKN
jgi:hypothetical protein